MSDVVHRTTLEYRVSVHTPDFPSGTWVINPDLSLLVGLIERKYWKVVGDDVLEMTQPEKDAVDAAEAQAALDALIEQIKERLSLGSAITDLAADTIVIAGLLITINVGTLIVDDETTIVADGSLTKTVNPRLVYNETAEAFTIEVFEKTDGLYEDFASDERLAFDFGEWTVVASGTVLVPV